VTAAEQRRELFKAHLRNCKVPDRRTPHHVDQTNHLHAHRVGLSYPALPPVTSRQIYVVARSATDQYLPSGIPISRLSIYTAIALTLARDPTRGRQGVLT